MLPAFTLHHIMTHIAPNVNSALTNVRFKLHSDNTVIPHHLLSRIEH